MSRLLKEYIPREHCMHHEQPLIWLHLISDFVIAASYLAIPVVLLSIYFARRHQLLFKKYYVLFGLFILFCGATHVMNIIAIWHSYYWLDGYIKAATAILSLITAILFPITIIEVIRKPDVYYDLLRKTTETQEKLNEVRCQQEKLSG